MLLKIEITDFDLWIDNLAAINVKKTHILRILIKCSVKLTKNKRYKISDQSTLPKISYFLLVPNII